MVAFLGTVEITVCRGQISAATVEINVCRGQISAATIKTTVYRGQIGATTVEITVCKARIGAATVEINVCRGQIGAATVEITGVNTVFLPPHNCTLFTPSLSCFTEVFLIFASVFLGRLWLLLTAFRSNPQPRSVANHDFAVQHVRVFHVLFKSKYLLLLEFFPSAAESRLGPDLTDETYKKNRSLANHLVHVQPLCGRQSVAQRVPRPRPEQVARPVLKLCACCGFHDREVGALRMEGSRTKRGALGESGGGLNGLMD